MAELTQRGIAALRSGDRATARRLLGSAVQQDPDDMTAWLWLSGAVDKDAERLYCLRQVLRIDPGNQAAARGTAQILEHRAAASGSTAPQPLSTAPPPRSSSPEPPQPADGIADAEKGSSSSASAELAVSQASAGPQSVSSSSAVETLRAGFDYYPVQEQVEPTVEASETLSDESQLNERITGVLGEPDHADLEPLPGGSTTGDPVHAEPAVVVSSSAPSSVRPSIASISTLQTHPVTGSKPSFRTRPSIAPALISFWVFFFGSIAAGNILSTADPLIGPLFALVIGFLLELVIVYIVVRNLRIRYELTHHHLSLPYQGQLIHIPIHEIYNAECHQSFFQRILNLGDIHLDANVNGELARLRLRDIAQCDVRAGQIKYLIQE